MDIVKYLDQFDKYSYNNTNYGLATAHLITGRLLTGKFLPFGSRSIDPRTSVIFLKPTFSGGSSAFDFVDKICKELGVNVYSLDEVNDAGLLGTNKKVKDEDGADDYEIVYGILGNPDIHVIYVDEGSILFNKNAPAYQGKIRNFIQKSLNPLGSGTSILRKKMARTEITIQPTQSMYIVSFFPSEVDESIVKTGLLQRTLLVCKHHTLNERLKNIYRDIDALGTKHDEKEFNDLVQSFKDTQAFIQTVPEFKVDPNVKPVLKGYADDLVDIVEGTSSVLQENAGSFVSAFQRHLAVLAWHHAIWRKSDIIDVIDVQYAYGNVIRPIFNDIVYWLEGKSEIQKTARVEKGNEATIRGIFDAIVKEQNKDEISEPLIGYVGFSTLAEAVVSNMGVSSSTAYRWGERLINEKKVTYKKVGNARYVRFLKE